MPEYREPGLAFTFEADDVWQPDKVLSDRRIEHVKACDFVWWDGNCLWLIEAKMQVPPLAGPGTDSSDPELTALREKLTNTLLLLAARAFERDPEWADTIPDRLLTAQAMRSELRCALVVATWRPDWAALLQTQFRQALLPVTNAFCKAKVFVLGVEEAKRTGIVVRSESPSSVSPPAP